MKVKSLLLFSIILSPLLCTPISPARQRYLSPSPQGVKRRVALVIGNKDYRDAPLNNPVNDAQDMARALRQLGFEVTYFENLRRDGMVHAIQEFGEDLRGSEMGLFYFSGHGIQVNRQNYLVPVDAQARNEDEVERVMIGVRLILTQLRRAKNHLNIVILDACRDNPFARLFRFGERGLAYIDAPPSTLIAYATTPDSVTSDGRGRDGIYTRQLLEKIQTPRLEIKDMFKQVRTAVQMLTNNEQVPWESSSLEDDFFFIEPSRPPTSNSSTEPRGAVTEGSTSAGGALRGGQTEEHTTKIKAIAENASKVLKDKKSKLKIEPEKSSPHSYYRAENAAKVLTETKNEILSGLAGKKLEGLRSYAMAEFPSPEQLEVLSRPDGRKLVTKSQADALYARAAAVIGFIAESDREVEITIGSDPGGATFELRTSPEGRDLIESFCTDSCIARRTRGTYDYQILKPGYKSKLFTMKIRNRAPKIKLDCKLVEEGAKDDPQPCKIIDQQ